jgi:predicted nucleic acid-binding protein
LGPPRPASRRRRLVGCVNSGQLWITPIVKLELLYSTRNELEFIELERVLDDMREAAIDRSVTRSAVTAMRELASMDA